mgnify:CR=1 FL=1|tara:strand:- start:2238 stop:2717 length:480 start_codon:yes stop_codon:yes gene_type:complete
MNVIIEVSKKSNLKYEYDKEKKCLILDRVLHNTNVFPYNYGFIPNTLSPDGDPLDIIILSEFELMPGSICNIKVIGGIDTSDESGQDDKIICVLDDKVDQQSKYTNDICDVNQSILDNIYYFLSHYKDGEKNKYVKIGDFYNKKKALNIIKKYTIDKKK